MPIDGTYAQPDTTGEYFRPTCKADRVFLRSLGIYRWRGRGARVERGSAEHRAIVRHMAAA